MSTSWLARYEVDQVSLVRVGSIAAPGCGVGSPIHTLARIGICRSVEIRVGLVTKHYARQLVEHVNKLAGALRGRSGEFGPRRLDCRT